MSKLSVIIPTYNIQQYLRQALDSVVNQTYKNLEIIIIDDNSADATPDIIREYAESDDRIKTVFHTENARPGPTRNEGLSLATGDYVTLMDHDDWQDLTKYEKMITKLEETGADFVVCDAEEYNQKRGKAFTKPWGKRLQKHPHEGKIDLSNWPQKSLFINAYTAPWAKIIRRELIEKYQIRFSGGANLVDDVLFHYHLMMVANSVCYVPEVLYTHRFFPGSISGQWREGGDVMIETRFDTWRDIEKLCTTYNIDPKLPLRYYIKKFAIYCYRADNSEKYIAQTNALLDRVGLTEDDLAKSYRKYYWNIRRYSPLRRALIQAVRRMKMLARTMVFGK